MLLRRKEYHKVCELCGKEFIAYAHNAKFCPDCRLEAGRARARKNRKYDYKKWRAWYEANRERHLRNSKMWKKKNRDYLLEYNKKYNAEHHEERLKYHREYNKKNREYLRTDARERYYDKCVAYWNSPES